MHAHFNLADYDSISEMVEYGTFFSEIQVLKKYLGGDVNSSQPTSFHIYEVV